MTTRTNRLRTFLFLIAFITTGAVAGVKEGIEAYKAKDYQTALKIFVPLAETGDPEAQILVANMYRNGHGLEQSDEKSFEWLQKAVNQGYPEAQLSLALIKLENIDLVSKEPLNRDLSVINKLSEAKELMLAAANGGSHFAQYHIGIRKKMGWHGFEVDVKNAYFWFLKSANNGNEDAMVVVGDAYFYGEAGHPSSQEKAFAWYKKGANRCQSDYLYVGAFNCKSFSRLARAYFYGYGTKEDNAKAFEYLKLATNKESLIMEPEAHYLLAVSYYYGYGTDIDYKNTGRIFSDLAKVEYGLNGYNKRASYMLGLMYLDGKGVPQNYIKAIEYFNFAASQKNSFEGYVKAKSMLGQIYFYGRGVPVDYQKSYAWFSLAAADGDADAQKNRDIVGAKLTPQQLISAQRIASEWARRDEERAANQDSGKVTKGGEDKAGTPRIGAQVRDSTKPAGRTTLESGKPTTDKEKLAPNPF